MTDKDEGLLMEAELTDEGMLVVSKRVDVSVLIVGCCKRAGR